MAALLLFAPLATSRPRDGRTMCEAAHSMISKLEPTVVQAASKHDPIQLVDRVNEFMRARHQPVERYFPEQDIPTEVVRMVMPEPLREMILSDALKVRELRQRLAAAVPMRHGYSDQYTLEFDFAALFNPACVEFMDLNRQLVKEKFPNMNTCLCNVFTVRDQREAYGLHHASALGYEMPGMGYAFGWFAPQQHVSFHTAVTPTTETSAPFSIFEDHAPEVLNNDAMFAYLLKAAANDSASFPPSRVHLLYTAYAHARPLLMLAPEFRSFQDYLTAVYWETRSCRADSSYGGTATWWELEPGDALFFNNWRAHSDNGLGSSESPRVTIDLRCFGPMTVPAPLHNSLDVIEGAAAVTRLAASVKALFSRFPRRRQDGENNGVHLAFLECLTNAMNMTSSSILQRLFPNQALPATYLLFALGSVKLNLIDAGRHSLMHEAQSAALRDLHQEIVRPLLDGKIEPNVEAFGQCHRAIEGYDWPVEELGIMRSTIGRFLLVARLLGYILHLICRKNPLKASVASIAVAILCTLCRRCCTAQKRVARFKTKAM